MCLNDTNSSFNDFDAYSNDSNIKNTSISPSTVNDDLYIDRIIVFFISLFICIFGCIFNLIVVYLIKKYEQFHEASMYVRGAYAIVDFSSGVIVILYGISRLFNNLERLSCWISDIGIGLFFTTFNLTALVAVERYFYFCEPMKYPRYFTLKTVTLFTCFICGIALGYTLGTEIIIGRKQSEFHGLCRLENQVIHKIIQSSIFFLPAILSTCFSIYKIGKLIYKTRLSDASNGIEVAMKNRIGRKAMR